MANPGQKSSITKQPKKRNTSHLHEDIADVFWMKLRSLMSYTAIPYISLQNISCYSISKNSFLAKAPAFDKNYSRNQLHQHHSTSKIPQHFRSPGFVLPCIEDYIIQHLKNILEHKPLNTFFLSKISPSRHGQHACPAPAKRQRHDATTPSWSCPIWAVALRALETGGCERYSFREVFHVRSYFDMGYDGYVLYTMWGPHVR